MYFFRGATIFLASLTTTSIKNHCYTLYQKAKKVQPVYSLQYYYFVCYFIYYMSRRQISPIRPPIRSEVDPRDNMIRKLKQDLLVARSREKELSILQNYLHELIQKTKLLTAETAKSDEEGKLKLELTVKSINQLKKQVEICRSDLKNINNELKAVEEEETQLKKSLNQRLISIQNLKKEGVCLHEDNQKLLNQHYRLRAQQDETIHEIKKLSQTIRNYQNRVNEINRKIMEVKSYIGEVSQYNTTLRQKLKNYEHQNKGIDDDLYQKENNIDQLERTFADKHDFIKNQVEGYIELEHLNEKNIKDTKHKANLVKIQNQKANQLNAAVSTIRIILERLDRSIAERSKELGQVQADSAQINQINEDFINKNTQLKRDLQFCQEHLQNLMKHNAFIQQQMENYVREDETIINIIRRKRLVPVINNYNSLRTSRNEAKMSNRTYQ